MIASNVLISDTGEKSNLSLRMYLQDFNRKVDETECYDFEGMLM
jgi:hypothetical protein